MPRVVVYLLCGIALTSAAHARAQAPLGDAEGAPTTAPPLADPAPTEPPGDALDVPERPEPREDGTGAGPDGYPAGQGGPGAASTISEVVQPPSSAVLQLVGGRVSVRSASGQERGVRVGCGGTTGVALDGEVYVLCPPHRVVRVRLAEDGSTSVRSGEARVDLVDLRVVDGVLHAVARHGGMRPLAAATRDDRGVSPFADLAAFGGEASSTGGRLWTALELAGRGHDASALRAFELAANTPSCPPHWWDQDAAYAAQRALDGLRAPADPGSNREEVFWGGVGALAFGGLGLVVGFVAFLADAFSGYSFYGGGSSGDGVDIVPYAATWIVSGAVLILGIALMAGSSLSASTGRDFRGRQRAVSRRMRAPRGTQPGQLFPAFGHSACATPAR